MRPHLALFATAALLLTGCASAAGGGGVAAPSGITGDWVLASATDADGPLDLAGTTITLTVDDDDFAGRAPCNSYSGTLVDGGAPFGGLAITEAACRVQALMELERRYVAALGSATRAAADGDVLVVGGAASVELRFEQAGKADPATSGLAGTAWTLTAVMRGDVVSEAVGSGVLAFASDGASLTGSAGCHGFASAYTEAGGVVALSGLDIAHTLCTDETGTDETGTDETAAQEDSVFAVLGDGLVVTRDGDTLTARNAVDGVPVSLVYSFQAS